MSEQLLKQFKKLERVSPSQEWAETTRNFLYQKIERETIGIQPTWQYNFRLFFVVWSRRIIPSPVKMVSVFTILAVMFGTNLVVEAGVIPPSKMIGVERPIEKVRLFFAFTPKSEIKVNLHYSDIRQRRVLNIASDDNISPEEKTRHINKVVKYLEGNVLGAANSLAIAKEDLGDNKQKQGEVAKLAIEITKNGQEAVKSLEQVKESANLAGVDKTVAEAQSDIEESGVSSLEVAVNQIKGQQEENAAVSSEQVKEVISQLIKSQSEKIEKLDAKADQVGVAEALNTDNSVKQIKDLNKDLVDVAEKSVQAKVILDEAKTSLAKDNLTEALDKVKQSTQITKQSKAVVTKIEDISLKKLQGNAVVPTTSTSTINLNNLFKDKIKDKVKQSTTTETTPEVILPNGARINPSLIYDQNSTSTHEEPLCLDCE
ncbi:MAG: hypothetical protein Q8P32_04180 [Candidatus Komeilibacteria bacterium]|nr:hypothetical protein [Candidatus Komeilibacteria bacterium]